MALLLHWFPQTNGRPNTQAKRAVLLTYAPQSSPSPSGVAAPLRSHLIGNAAPPKGPTHGTCFTQPQVLHLAATLVAFARIRVALMMIPGTFCPRRRRRRTPPEKRTKRKQAMFSVRKSTSRGLVLVLILLDSAFFAISQARLQRQDESYKCPCAQRF